MKKILFLFAAIVTMMFTACNGCKQEPVTPAQEDDFLVITTDDWEEIIQQVVPFINKNFSEYAFYEASGLVKQIDKGDVKYGIDHNTFRCAFGHTTKAACVVGEIVNDTFKVVKHDEPWLEDLFTTPYVGLDLNMAILEMQKKIDIDPVGQPVVFRHELYWKNDYEPKYFIGTFNNCHTITAYSVQIDLPLEGTENKFVAAESGLKAAEAEKK